MREIKFRAWGAWNNNMKPEMAYSNGKGCDYGITLDGKPVYLDWGGGVSGLFGLTLMQYTGLKDKNGKEIYEGDIVRVNETAYSDSIKQKQIRGADIVVQDYIGKIEWDNEGADYNCVFTDGSLVGFPRHEQVIEIIGNIYENPELLKKNNDKK